ncbi:hypothetical protein B9Z55_026000 [Caenorhabditis nigoni]|uniref:SPK domain-containing protein n=1 Tax=Caenorhabditis nigoni TaxID=1611254 RepID=A0A2G5T1B8_9PELO|nr:hypothetical protein B9Z55_026000 [Caenorhabditis nigoni]
MESDPIHPENIVIGENENGYNSSENTFSGVLKQRLDKIEDHQGFTLMEKVRLVFIFSRPVSPGFLKILKDAKCVVKLNDERKITYFSSPDGTVFESKQSKGIPKENRKIIKIDDVEMKNEDEEEAPGPIPTNNWHIQKQYALSKNPMFIDYKNI